MPTEIYEIVAQGARYWFLFLMTLIVWRSYRWYRKDQRQRKKRLRLLPDAGFIGEMVVLQGGGSLKPGEALAVPREGLMGFSRRNDLCVPVTGVANKHCWFRFDPDQGLRVEPFYGKKIKVDGEERTGRKDPLYMTHGSRLWLGEAQLRLRLFAGFEAPLRRCDPLLERESPEEEPQPQAAPPQPIMTREQFALWQQQIYQQQAMQQMAYLQWMAQHQPSPGEPSQTEKEVTDWEQEPPVSDPEASSAFQESDLPTEAWPQTYASQIEFETQEEFYPPQREEEPEDDWPYAIEPSVAGEASDDFYPETEETDEDLTDAAAPPKSAYVGRDEAEHAKKRFWDKYLGGDDPR